MPPAKTTAPPPAYFLALSLENVRSFGEKQTIHFTEGGKEGGKPAQWTVILGDNGVGKTTVLKALAAMVTEDRPIDGQNPDIAAMWRLANSGWSPNRWDSLSADLETEVVQDQELQSGKIGKNFQVIESYVGKTNGAGMMSRGRNPRSLVCYGYGASRTTGNSTLSETPETLDTCASLFNDRADLLNPEEFFLFADYWTKSDQDPQVTKTTALLKAALLKVMEEGEVTEIDVAPVLLKGSGPRQGVRFKTPYGWVRLRDMSLGYQTLAVWLTDFASKLFIRYPDNPNPLEMPAIVLIDEIDLHLHPSWQRKLLKSLSEIFTNTQFIATAHSPLVVQAAGDEGANVVLLRREGDQTVVSQNPVDVRGWRVDQILTSTFFNLETARSVDTEKKMTRQATLLNKQTLTAKQRKELDDLTLELEGQPMGSVGAEEEEEAMLHELTRRVGKRPKA